MASQVIVEDFSGSGSLAGTSPGELTGVGAVWATYSSSGTPNNAFTRSGAGAVVTLPLDSFARLDPYSPSLTHSAGVTVVQAAVRPGMQMHVFFDTIDGYASINFNPDGSGAWAFDGPTSSGAGSFSAAALSPPSVARVEITSTQARYYISGALVATHSAGGMPYGSPITSIRFGQLASFSNGLANGAVVTALFELQAVTDTVSGPLGPAGNTARISAPGPLQAMGAWIGIGRFAQVSAPSPIGAPALRIEHDFTGQLDAVGAVEIYVCDLVDEEYGDSIRVPISSWQGTMRLDGSCYLQAVIPAVADLASTINGLGEAAVFIISRCARLPNGDLVVSEMARSLAENRQFDQGPQRWTCTLSGYSAAMTAPEGGIPPLRILRGVRSISSGGASVRVRCAIDWFLRPGTPAMAGAVALIPDWISYYVGGGDAYMDAGVRA